VTVALATVLAAAIGYMAAPSHAGSPASSRPGGTASAGAIEVTIPAEWHRVGSERTPRLGLSNELVLARVGAPGDDLAVGAAITTDASLLPRTVLRSVTSKPSPQVVTLGADQFYRYIDLRPTGAAAPESLYALPTTKGTVIGVCRPSGLASRCEQVLASLRVKSGRVLGLGPDPAVGSALNRVLAQLNPAVAAAGARLRAATNPAGQAAGAREISTAYEQAASAIGGLAPGPAAASALVKLSRALSDTARGYGELAAAASTANQTRYHVAQSSVAIARRRISAALVALAQLGYVVSR
jgi:hypothetical protein